MEKNSIDVLVLNDADNLQYLNGVTDPTLHTCGTLVLPIDKGPVMIVLWGDIEVAKEQSKIQNINYISCLSAIQELSSRYEKTINDLEKLLSLSSLKSIILFLLLVLVAC